MIKGIVYLYNQKQSRNTCIVARVKDVPVMSCFGFLFPVPGHTVSIFSHTLLY